MHAAMGMGQNWITPNMVWIIAKHLKTKKTPNLTVLHNIIGWKKRNVQQSPDALPTSLVSISPYPAVVRRLSTADAGGTVVSEVSRILWICALSDTMGKHI